MRTSMDKTQMSKAVIACEAVKYWRIIQAYSVSLNFCHFSAAAVYALKASVLVLV